MYIYIYLSLPLSPSLSLSIYISFSRFLSMHSYMDTPNTHKSIPTDCGYQFWRAEAINFWFPHITPGPRHQHIAVWWQAKGNRTECPCPTECRARTDLRRAGRNQGLTRGQPVRSSNARHAIAGPAAR